MTSLTRVDLHILDRRPELGALAGAVAIAFSGILFRYADVSAVDGRLLPLLLRAACAPVIGIVEDGRLGPRTRRARLYAYLAGAFFAADLVLWHHSIDYVGAGARDGARQHAGG